VRLASIRGSPELAMRSDIRAGRWALPLAATTKATNKTKRNDWFRRVIFRGFWIGWAAVCREGKSAWRMMMMINFFAKRR
jgi:hypothetical protein